MGEAGFALLVIASSYFEAKLARSNLQFVARFKTVIANEALKAGESEAISNSYHVSTYEEEIATAVSFTHVNASSIDQLLLFPEFRAGTPKKSGDFEL